MLQKLLPAVAISAAFLLLEVVPACAQVSSDARLLKDFGGEFSQDEVRQLRNSIGRVDCRAAVGRGVWSTGFLVGKTDILVTTAHTFFNENGREVMPLSRCTFSLIGGRTFQINWNRARIGSRRPRDSSQNGIDYVIVRLKQATVGSAGHLRADQAYSVNGPPVFMISAPSTQSPPKAFTDLLARSCDIKFIFDNAERPGVTASTSCSSGNGTSGSAILRRGQDGSLSVIGLHSGRGHVFPVGQKPSFATKAEAQRASLSKELLFRGPLLNDLREMMQ